MTEQKERELYFWLRLIREFEDRISALDKQGKIMGGVYSGKGQEAVVVGVCHDLRPDDWIFPLHRDLGAFLVKGADPNRLMAQLFGRRDGFSKGKDSFLHGGDFSRCIFGATSMLGSTLPVAVGTAYKFKIKREDRVAIAFFGEGASSRGDVHEAMNFAGIYKLPVVFLCENNFYAYSTPNELQFAVEDVPLPRPFGARRGDLPEPGGADHLGEPRSDRAVGGLSREEEIRHRRDPGGDGKEREEDRRRRGGVRGGEPPPGRAGGDGRPLRDPDHGGIGDAGDLHPGDQPGDARGDGA